MNKCTDSDIQEMLPDLLHRALADDARKRVEAHVATCESCREDLDVLRMVKSAAVFAPSIDVDRVVRQIPPYRTIVPEVEMPARPRFVSWLVAASLAIVVLGGGSLLLMQPKSATRAVATDGRGSGLAIPGTPSKVTPEVLNPGTPALRTARGPHTHALVLATDVEGLTDTDLLQLINDMNRFDALPASEPEPVISVDSGDSLGQDTR